MRLTDDQLLDAVALLYADLDPAPPDLADGVLARLAVEDLEHEYELLTLVDRVDHAAGTRGVLASDAATVALEFAGTTYRVLVRISTTDGRRRLDGWVVPAVPLRAYLGPQGDALHHTLTHSLQSADADADGRFEFPDPVTGQVRLWLLPRTEAGQDTPAAPFVTPPFLL
jgi:hypothetical protein